MGFSNNTHKLLLILSVIKTYARNIDNTEEKTGSHNFWNKCKPYFSNKYENIDSKILLIGKEEFNNENAKVINVFNSYFESVTDSLFLFNWASDHYNQAKDSTERIIQKLSHHPRIIKIKQKLKISTKFYFAPVTTETVRNIVNGLPKNKSENEDITRNVLRRSGSTFSYLAECINVILRNAKFPDPFSSPPKLSDIVPVYNKIDSIDQIFDQLAFCRSYKRFSKHINKFLNSLLPDFRKFHSTFLRDMPHLDDNRPAKKSLISLDLLALYLWIYLKLMNACLLIY